MNWQRGNCSLIQKNKNVKRKLSTGYLYFDPVRYKSFYWIERKYITCNVIDHEYDSTYTLPMKAHLNLCFEFQIFIFKIRTRHSPETLEMELRP